MDHYDYYDYYGSDFMRYPPPPPHPYFDPPSPSLLDGPRDPRYKSTSESVPNTSQNCVEIPAKATARALPGDYMEVECVTARVTISPSKAKNYAYSVKVINKSRKSDYTVKHLGLNPRFSSLGSLNKKVESGINLSCTQLGYIEPGHGVKGKQRWLSTDEDVEEMYNCFKGKKEILLWCYYSEEIQSKEPSGNSDVTHAPEGTSKKSLLTKKISEIECLVDKLRKWHGNAYSVEHFNCWAHLIHVGKQDSFDFTPDLPYFRGNKKRKKQDANEATPEKKDKETPAVTSVITSYKRMSLRSECINQLGKWHSLLEKGAISQTQYDDMQKAIMKDMFDNF